MVVCRLFAFDCVTFQSDTWKINPAPWTRGAGDTSPFIVPWTAPYSAAGLTVKKNWDGRKTEMRRRKERAQRPHTHSYTSCLLISLKPGVFGHKQMTMDACSLKDWFTNELFELIYEDGRNFIRKEEREKYPPSRLNTRRKMKYRKYGPRQKYK